MHTGTTRGNYLPVDTGGTPCSVKRILETPNLCDGGIWNRAYHIEKIRNSTQFSLLLECGNFWQGTLFSRSDPAAIFDFMNILGYDAIAMGPRDFDIDEAIASQTQILVPLIKNSTFVTLAANVDASNDMNYRNISNFVALKMFDFEGVKVGIIGTVDDNINFLSRGVPRNFSISSRINGIAKGVDYLLNHGINKIILMVNEQYSNWDYISNLTSLVPGIDVVVSSYDDLNGVQSNNPAYKPRWSYPYIVYSPSGKPIPIVSPGRLGLYLGRLDIEFDSLGVITNYSGDVIRLTSDYNHTTFSQSIQDLVLDRWDKVEKINSNATIGNTNVLLNGSISIIRYVECPLGNLVTDAIRAESGAQIGIQNGGGINGLIYPGNITVKDGYTVIPFTNIMSVVEVTGIQIIQILQNSVLKANTSIFQNVPGSGRFLQFSGLKFAYNPNANNTYRKQQTTNLYIPDRVVWVKVLENGVWKPLDLTKNYTMAINEFLLAGGNEYEMFPRSKVVKPAFSTLDSVLARYLAYSSPINTSVEGRIIRTDEEPTNFFFNSSEPLPYWQSWEDPASIVCILLASIMMVVLIGTFIWVQLNKNHNAVTSSSTTFLCIIIVGMIVCLFSVYLWIGEPTIATCIARIWFLSIGFSLTYGALIIKNWRVMKLFTTDRLDKIKPIRDHTLGVYLGILCLVCALLISLWSGVDPPMPSYTNPVDGSYLVVCQSNSSLWGILSICYGGIFLLAGLYVSFRTRNIPQKFRESLHISWVTYNLVIIGGIITVIGYFIPNNLIALNFVIYGIVICCLFTWGIMFIPKFFVVYDLFQDNGKNQFISMETLNSNVSIECP